MIKVSETINNKDLKLKVSEIGIMPNLRGELQTGPNSNFKHGATQ